MVGIPPCFVLTAHRRVEDSWKQCRGLKPMERVYQGSTLLFVWELKLKPETPWVVTFTQTVEELVKEMH